jgi:CSLREA domain-containing protein
VNTTADETTSGDQLCSLREAIAAANSPGSQSDCGITIVAGSSRGGNCSGSSPSAITDAGQNLSFPDTTCPGINGDPKLLGLKNYGGPTNTLALASGSPAIDQVPATGAGCPPTDQRGVKRPQGSACDIVAFEFAAPHITVTSPANGASHTVGSTVLAAYRCTEGGITGPIATCTGTVANEQPIDTSSTGTEQFTVSATDQAGNQTTQTVTYTITP